MAKQNAVPGGGSPGPGESVSGHPWLRNKLVLPLLVGVLVGMTAVSFQFAFADELELSYRIDRPTPVLDPHATQQVKIEANGIEVKELMSFRVQVWNSGDLPIRDLPVLLVFQPLKADFSILSTTHQTLPEHQFGEIRGSEPEKNQRLYEFELLNEGDEDVITLLASSAAEISLHAKAAGLSLVQRASAQEEMPRFSLTVLVGCTIAPLIFLMAFLSGSMHRRAKLTKLVEATLLRQGAMIATRNILMHTKGQEVVEDAERLPPTSEL